MRKPQKKDPVVELYYRYFKGWCAWEQLWPEDKRAFRRFFLTAAKLQKGKK